MLLYHKNATDPVDCHPTQIEWMKSNGWTEGPPEKKKPPAKKESKPETKPAT